MAKRLSRIVLVTILAVLLVGCGYEETKEYELLTIRRYSETEETGLFTTKRDVEWYIEYTYKTEHGTEKYTFNEKYDYHMEISEDNKVVLEKGEFDPIVYITLEQYKELYGVDDVNKEVGGENG